MHITASVFINDDADLWASCTTAPARTPVLNEVTGTPVAICDNDTTHRFDKSFVSQYNPLDV
jgi:hypothetical protein